MRSDGRLGCQYSGHSRRVCLHAGEKCPDSEAGLRLMIETVALSVILGVEQWSHRRDDHPDHRIPDDISLLLRDRGSVVVVD